MKTYLLLLIIIIAGCDREAYDHRPHGPWPDPGFNILIILAHDITPDGFVFRLVMSNESELAWGYAEAHIVLTYRGHYENDINRPFEFRTETAVGLPYGPLQYEYYGTAHRTIDSSLADHDHLADIELPFQHGERGIVTSVVIEILPWPVRWIPYPADYLLLQEDIPYVIGLSDRIIFFVP